MDDLDRYLFNEGTHRGVYRALGAQIHPTGGAKFAVWAPNAVDVAVVGDFCEWRDIKMHSVGDSGVWAGVAAEARPGHLYKYAITTRSGERLLKADPVGFAHEVAPQTASIITALDYAWRDADWMRTRGQRISQRAPVSIYEVHLGSWMREHGDHGQMLGYRQLAERLAEHAGALGFTHVELLPVMEHPFYGSWGYQTTGYFAPTRRYGEPRDFMEFIDTLHRAGLGVILDWVPSHFPNDSHGLALFDGTCLYEHEDPRRGFHPDWKSCIFNYGRHEVRSFLISSALFWLDHYHVDGIRVDAVASMLYLDYSRGPGEWLPNNRGGNENDEAVAFLQALNTAIYAEFPDVQTFAEESTAWDGVTRTVASGGLGFGYKWDMGWMHDTLSYLAREPVHRRFHHNEVTFRAVYRAHENYVLPLSHDEVVHGKGALLEKFPGDEWQRFATLRLLLGYQFAQPGKKLLFMGSEWGVTREWNHDEVLAWGSSHAGAQQGMLRWLKALNQLYRSVPALHLDDCKAEGFDWIANDDAEASTLAFLRWADARCVIVVCNFTPVVRHEYRVGIPTPGSVKLLLCSDASEFGGSGVDPLPIDMRNPWHGRPYSIGFTLPPLSIVFLQASEAV